MCNKNCGCKRHNKCGCKKKVITCYSVLEGTFTKIDGTVFKAAMSATGSGYSCKSAKKDTEVNIQKTLEDFLATYKPKIVKETHTVKTTCDGCHPVPPDPPKNGILKFRLKSDIEEKEEDGRTILNIIFYDEEEKKVVGFTRGTPLKDSPFPNIASEAITYTDDHQVNAVLEYDGESVPIQFSFAALTHNISARIDPLLSSGNKALAYSTFGISGTTSTTLTTTGHGRWPVGISLAISNFSAISKIETENSSSKFCQKCQVVDVTCHVILYDA